MRFLRPLFARIPRDVVLNSRRPLTLSAGVTAVVSLSLVVLPTLARAQTPAGVPTITPVSAPSGTGGAAAPAPTSGARTGRIRGLVRDSASGAPLANVGVQVTGTSIGAATGPDGRFLITGVPVGWKSLTIRRIGFAPKTIDDIAVRSDKPADIDAKLVSVTVKLTTQSIMAAGERGSVNESIEQQRRAPQIVNAITREQISRSADGDAAQAVQRVSGVSVQDGKYVFVRGLGERYTNTSLNGARIPSPEPERKVVPLDLFPAGLLQTITTSKTFTPSQPGDFSGAQVDIKTREFPVRRQVVLSSAMGFNDAVREAPVLRGRSAGGESFAMASGNRALPAGVRAAGNFSTLPTQQEMNTMVRSFRNAWSPSTTSGAMNRSLGLSVGGRDPFFGRSVGYLLSGTYSFGQEVQRDYRRAQALAGSTPGQTETIDAYAGAVARTSVLWGGVLTAATSFGDNTRVTLNQSYNRTADDEARDELGWSENLGTALNVRRLRYVERSVRSTQLAADHNFGQRRTMKWSITSSGVARREPDRSEIVYAIQNDPSTNVPLPPAWLSVNSEGAVRTFGDLGENALEASADYRWQLGDLAAGHALQIGGLFRSTNRDADNRAYSIIGALPRAVREQAPEQIFTAPYTNDDSTVFQVVPLGTGGSYSATDRLGAGYAMLEIGMGDRLKLITGARMEVSRVSVMAQPTIGAAVRTTPDYVDVLPSLALNLQMTESQALRFAVSQTLARPEYREMAPVQYREVLGGDNVIGNADLRRTLIQNGDARWEWYPAPGEIVSIGVFAKRFRDPIERIYLATSGTRVVTFANAASASNYGTELEVRKGLGGWFDGMTVFGNATLMHSRITIGSGGASKTNSDRAMVGQAPYVVNGGLTYATASNRASLTALYNIVGERIVNAAEAPLPDVREQPRATFDLSARFPLFGQISARMDGKNLLDTPYELRQGTVVREHYRTGRTFQFGLSWTR